MRVPEARSDRDGVDMKHTTPHLGVVFNGQLVLAEVSEAIASVVIEHGVVGLSLDGSCEIVDALCKAAHLVQNKSPRIERRRV